MSKPNEDQNKKKNESEVAAAAEDDEIVDTLSEAAVILGSSYTPEGVCSDDDDRDKEVAGTPDQTQLPSWSPLPPLLDGQRPKVTEPRR
jgi:hypothetical protein